MKEFLWEESEFFEEEVDLNSMKKPPPPASKQFLFQDPKNLDLDEIDFKNIHRTKFNDEELKLKQKPPSLPSEKTISMNRVKD